MIAANGAEVAVCGVGGVVDVDEMVEGLRPDRWRRPDKR